MLWPAHTLHIRLHVVHMDGWRERESRRKSSSHSFTHTLCIHPLSSLFFQHNYFASLEQFAHWPKRIILSCVERISNGLIFNVFSWQSQYLAHLTLNITWYWLEAVHRPSILLTTTPIYNFNTQTHWETERKICECYCTNTWSVSSNDWLVGWLVWFFRFTYLLKLFSIFGRCSASATYNTHTHI